MPGERRTGSIRAEDGKEPHATLFNYPPELPICAFRQEILDTLSKNNIIVVCGETGSGKTTQLPKMAMELGCGKNGRKIACTQPRRVAATTVAERVAKELNGETGGIAGYQHRFGKKLSDSTVIKFMTDGILLSETMHDPLLEAYDAIIIDEAHERTLNIDFLLGILKRISEKRADLKVIISSATLDTAKFSGFFSGAPAITVPGRLFPVEISHVPADDEEGCDLLARRLAQPRNAQLDIGNIYVPETRNPPLVLCPFCPLSLFCPFRASTAQGGGRQVRAEHPHGNWQTRTTCKLVN